MGTRALLYYFSTTMLAAVVGIICVLSIHPGDPSIKGELGSGAKGTTVSTLDTFMDLLRLEHSHRYLNRPPPQKKATKQTSKRTNSKSKTRPCSVLNHVSDAAHVHGLQEHVPVKPGAGVHPKRQDGVCAQGAKPHSSASRERDNTSHDDDGSVYRERDCRSAGNGNDANARLPRRHQCTG